MRLKWLLPGLIIVFAGVAGCSQKAEPPKPAAAATKSTLGIHPYGTADPNFKPDYSKLPADLQKTFAYIDEHVDEHAENIQKWIRQPSISNSGEGIPESADMVKGFFEKLGCQAARVYDTGLTEYGSQGNPVVYAKCDEGAAEDRRDLLAVRHHAGHAAGRLDRAAVRRTRGRRRDRGRARGVARDHRPRCDQFQRAGDGRAERDQFAEGRHRQAARESDLRRRR